MVDTIDLVLPAPRTRGRASAPARVTYVRDLSPEDIASLGVERGIQPHPVKRLRDSHHTVARLLALGHRPGQVAALTGYSLSRISILQSDPAFMELLSFYRENQSEEFLAQKAALDERMLDAALDAVSLLQERIDEDPDSVTNHMALEIAKTFADRTGYAPVNKSVSLNGSLDLGTRLANARERLKIIECQQGLIPDRGVESPSTLAGEIPTQRSGENRDPLGDGSVGWRGAIESGAPPHQLSPGGDPTARLLSGASEVGPGNADNAPRANKSGIALAPESAVFSFPSESSVLGGNSEPALSPAPTLSKEK